MGERVVTVNDVLDGHTVLDLSCLDRLYLSGFVQKLQTPGGVVYFLHEHRGMPIPSPAVFDQIGSRFRDGMRRFAETNHIPVVRFSLDFRCRNLIEAGAACWVSGVGSGSVGAGRPTRGWGVAGRRSRRR
jgi:hypothetical protein